MGTEVKLTDCQKAELIGIKVHYLSENQTEYRLLEEDLNNKEICEELNKAPFKTKYKLSNLLNLSESEDKTDVLKGEFTEIEQKPIKDMIGQDIQKIILYRSLSVPYVRFSGNIILQEDKDEYIKECQESILKGLSLIYKFNPEKKKLLNEEKYRKKIQSYEDVKETLETLNQICILSSSFSLSSLSSSENYIWNELLQNANDHISENEMLNIEIGPDSLILEYPENVGFTVRDFVAISTDGNSANVLSDENREGRKGTGFKSVYKLFNKVEITSGRVKCVLEDKCQSICFIEKDNKIEAVYDQEKWEEKKWYFPIPEFSENEAYNKQEKNTTTKFVFHYKDDNIREKVLEMIFGKVKDNLPDYEKAFIEKKDYLFLNKIGKISLSIDGKKYEIERKVLLEDYDCFLSQIWEDNSDKEYLQYNSYWERKKGTDSYKSKKQVTVLFPKNLELKDNADERAVYCTLPINEFKIKMPFYINIPLLELKDDRLNIASAKTERDDFEEWNKQVLSAVFEEDGPVYRAFVEFSEKSDSNLNQETLYRYFPYEYLEGKNTVGKISIDEEIRSYPFIRTINTVKKEISCRCLNDLVTEKDIDNKDLDKFIFLPGYMIRWFCKNKGLEGFSSEIPFVYYNCQEEKTDTHVCNELFKKIKKFYSKAPFLCYKKTELDRVGQILLDIKSYLYEKAKKIKNDEEKRKLFKEFLKEIWDSKEFCMEPLFKAFLLSLSSYDENTTYHCIGNINLENRKFNEIDNIESMEEIVDEIRDVFFNLSHIFLRDEVLAIKSAVGNVRDSLYFDMEIAIVEENQLYQTNITLREDFDFEIDKIDSKIKYVCTTELLSSYWKDEFIETVKNWIKDDTLFLSAQMRYEKQYTSLSQKTYYANKQIQNPKNSKYIVLDHSDNQNYFKILKELGIKCLDEEIEGAEFYNDVDSELIKEVLKKYNLSCKEGVLEYLESKDFQDEEKCVLLLEQYLKWLDAPNNPQMQICKWNNKLKNAISQMKSDLLWAEYDVFDFPNKNSIKKISRNLKNRFEMKVSSEEKEMTVGENLSLGDFVENKIYLLESEIGNRKLFCRGKKNEESIIVLFSEKSFDKLLRELGCKSYSEEKPYEEMHSGAVNSLVGFCLEENLEEVEIEEIKSRINKIRELMPEDKREGEDFLLNCFIERWDIYIQEKRKWINAQGYGGEYCEDKKCPLCDGNLIAEKSLLQIGYLLYRAEHNGKIKNYYLPLPMCKNCYESLKYTEDVIVEFENPKELHLDDTKMYEMRIQYNMYPEGVKEITNAKISFFARHWWNQIINKKLNEKLWKEFL